MNTIIVLLVATLLISTVANPHTTYKFFTLFQGQGKGGGQGQGGSHGKSGSAPGHGGTPPGHGGTPPGHTGESGGGHGQGHGKGHSPKGYYTPKPMSEEISEIKQEEIEFKRQTKISISNLHRSGSFVTIRIQNFGRGGTAFVKITNLDTGEVYFQKVLIRENQIKTISIDFVEGDLKIEVGDIEEGKEVVASIGRV